MKTRAAVAFEAKQPLEIVVPRGTEYRPCARKGEVKLFVMDADGTPNTGDGETAFKPMEV